MSEHVDNMIQSEVNYLTDQGKGFDTAVNIVLIARKAFNDIVSQYLEEGKQDTLPLVRALAGHLSYFRMVNDAPCSSEQDDSKVDFGSWAFCLNDLVTAAEVLITTGEAEDLCCKITEIETLCRGWLSQYHVDIEQREGYEVEDEVEDDSE